MNSQVPPLKIVKKSRLAQERETRLAKKPLYKAIEGLIVYFEDRQIRQRPSKGSSLVTFNSGSAASKSRITFNYPSKKENKTIEIPMFLSVRNSEGEWPSQIHFLPKKLGRNGRTYITVQDSNMFISAFSSFPLYLIREKNTDRKSEFLTSILKLAQKNIASYKRGDSYNFWPQQEPYYGSEKRTAPFNIWSPIADKFARVYIHPSLRKTIHRLSTGLAVPGPEWVERCMTSDENTAGADSLLNIANDADDTSMAIALQKLHHLYLGQNHDESIDLKPLALISQFRDINRFQHQETNTNEQSNFFKNNTGAYLTWLKEEDEPTFSDLTKGVIPGGANNVDIVVNANVLFSMALNKQEHLPGYKETCELMVHAIEKKLWPQAGIYYPQNMIFPYCISRAIRDGAVDEPKLIRAQQTLLKDLLKEVKTDKRKESYFSGGEDPNHHYSTALGLITLLNIGSSVAEDIGQSEKYYQTIEECLSYLLNQQKKEKCRNKETNRIFSAKPKDKIVSTWDDGLFFSSSRWDLGQWRSESVTNAAVLEALIKYLWCYEKDSNLKLENLISKLVFKKGPINNSIRDNPLAFDLG